ncbi:sulfatase [Microbulbifer agarilyticus]|uniref:sulfatase n=1 Tax=Microbulbifer agarilyticus TaxID=260552 RepID=UPI001C96976E|nr:sulfatase [Microbulbifer agarilyticus]MBY6210931.1 sulfatase [Microbulbifer agarilyticus]
MNRLVLWVLAIALLFAQALSAKENQPLNVVLIIADDLRMNIGAYGDEFAKTPNIDALANESVRFNRAYVQFASCNASRSSMLTGKYPDTIGVWRLNTHFRKTTPDVVTLPQHFKRNGYHTESIGKVFHNYANITDPASWSVPARLDQASHFTDYVMPKSLAPGKKKGVATEVGESAVNQYVDDKITADAVATLKRLKDTRTPFFLAIGFMKPHSPFNAPKRFWDIYNADHLQALGEVSKPEQVPAINWFDYKELRTLSDLPKRKSFSEAQQKRLVHGYYTATSYLDDNLGQVIHALKANQLYDNTLIVFASDHGYHLGENSHWTKATVRELDAQVPLLVKLPGNQGAISNALIEYVDLYPTLSEFAGIGLPANVDGTSFHKVLQQPQLPHKTAALSQAVRPWPSNKPVQQIGYSIRTDKYRYTRWVDVKTQRTLAEEVYRINEDRLQRRNLIETLERGELDFLRGALATKLGVGV